MKKYIPITIDKCQERVPVVSVTTPRHVCSNPDSKFYKEPCNFDEFKEGCPYHNQQVNIVFKGL